MLLPRLLAFALVPLLASAAIFPPGTLVQSIDAKGFKKAMKENVCLLVELHLILLTFYGIRQRTSLVAFVAPWCGVRLLHYFPLTIVN